MGSVRLKKKTELNYRKGPTHKNCGDCNHFVKDFEVHGIAAFGSDPSAVLRVEPRCKIIGLGNSVKYRIREDHICDRHNNSERLKRLGVIADNKT